jgi:hypothetical protein
MGRKYFNSGRLRAAFGRRARRAAASRRQLSLEALEGRTLLAGLTIAQENQLPGTPQSQWDVLNAGDMAIQGFTTDISYNQGQPVSFKVSDTALAPYRIDIYRMGYYQGNGARLVTTIPSSQTVALNQPVPAPDPTTGLVDCGAWQVTATWQMPADATSGIYFARLVREDTGGASHVFFVVRNDTGHSDLLFQTADTTWQAYNAFGGNSLYTGSTNFGGGRAVKVSYNRPLTVRATGGGLGSYNSPFHSEYPMVRWLEQNGYDVSYFTDVDSDRYGSEILEHKSFLSVGHDEYWSGQQRANVEAARDAGVNLAFFSGNEVFWKVRWETSVDGTGTPYRTLVCYKESKDNAKTDPSPVWTGTFRDDRFSPPADGGNPENSLTGTAYMNDRTNVDIGINMQVPADFTSLRFWRNTPIANLPAGQVATVGDRVVGYETDEDLDNGFRPAGLIDMSATTFTSTSHVIAPWGTVVGTGSSTHSITLYRAQSGALVFSAGSVQWSWGLDGQHLNGNSVPDPSMQQATVNLLADMGVQPVTLQSGLVRAVMSTDVTAPTAAVSTPAQGVNLAAGTAVTISGTASDVGGVVGGVEVSTDGGRTWRKAVGRNTWTYSWLPTAVGPTTILARAADDSGNVEVPANGIAVTVTPQPTSRTGLVGEWGFNEGTGSAVADSSGQGNNGLVEGPAWAPGFYGTGLRFDGINDWVTVNASASLNLTTGLTLEAWVNPTAAAAWRAVAVKEQPGGLNYGLYSSTNNGLPQGVVNQGGDRNATGQTPVPFNTWTHLAVTLDNGLLNLYVNGTLAASQSAPGNITSSTSPLRFGGDAGFGEFFQGLIDEVRLYNRPLSQGEIRVDMSTRVGGTLETTPPAVSVTSPAPGSVSGDRAVTAAASDNVLVTQVQFMLNGVPLGVPDTAAPYSVTWRTAQFSNGTYVLTAVARDQAGNTTTSAPVSVTVSNPPDVVRPSVTVKYPYNGSRLSGPIVLWSTASDNIGVVGVQYQVDGVNVGTEDLAAPYRSLLDTTTLADGGHTLTAVARDAAGNTSTSAPISFIVDNSSPPFLTARTPAPDATGVPATTDVQMTFSEDVDPSTILFDLRNAGGQLVPGTLSYDPSTFVATFSASIVLDVNATYTVNLRSVRDSGGVAMPSPVSWSFTTGPFVSNVGLWRPTAVPAVASDMDTRSIEVGVRFTPKVSGFVTGVRFYKGAANTGAHVGRLWTDAGQMLGTVSFTNETATGWQQADFTDPIAVTAGQTYVVSYYAPVGRYASTSNYFATSPRDGGLLVAPANGTATPNGVFRYGTGGVFPTSTYNAANYWVDVAFTNRANDTTPPSVVVLDPAAASSGAGVNGNVVARFSEPVTPGSISFSLRDPGGNVVPASVAYDSSTFTATLDPASALAYGTTYTATLAGAADANGNVMATTTWSFTTTATPDVTPPAVASLSPSAGATNVPLKSTVTATFNEQVNPSSVLFELRDAFNQIVSSTVSYDAATRTATLRPVAALAYSSTYTVAVRATDLSGNAMASPATSSFSTLAPAVAATIWSASAAPATASANDPGAVELGLKFRSDSDGYVSGIRFYKGTGNTGTHVGHLWSATGTLLGSVTFTDEGATGWQEADFTTPVAVSANQTYVVSYYAPAGHYSLTSGYFATSGVTTGPLTALASGVDGPNGVYRYGAGGGFPSTSTGSTNYWVDVVFDNVLIVDTTPPTVADRSPAPGTTGVLQGANVTATFSERVVPESISFVVTDAANNPVTGVLTYDSATRKATFNPTGPLNANATYTVTVSGTTDRAGNVMAATTWSFTVAPPLINATIWDSSATPATAAANDSGAVELGVKFRAGVDGYVTGIRFYKGAGNTGTHVGHLWSSTGQLLGTVTFADETAGGWQQANFDQPVAVSANQTYVVSYYAPVGRYSVTTNYFATSGVTKGPLTALASGVDGANGVYRYAAGGGFPSSSSNSSNYWVDAVFASTPDDLTAPAVIRATPSNGTTFAPTSANVTARFTEAVQAQTISLVLRDAANNVVPAAVTYDAVAKTVTLDPSADLVEGVTYTATLSGAQDAAGNVMTPVSWSFTAAKPIVNASIWGTGATPATAAASDSNAVEVGVKFRASVDGYVTGVRFYKGATNTGTHVGHLWSSTGALLATVTFVNETASGWQQALFDQPVAISAGQTYVVSYLAPVGRYAVTNNYFATAGVTSGALTALASGADGANGVYRYGAGGGFPNSTSGSSNYWVDVLFSTTVP